MYQPFFALQRRLEELNPAMETLASEQMMKPDGDVELAPEEVENFRFAVDQRVPECDHGYDGPGARSHGQYLTCLARTGVAILDELNNHPWSGMT